MSTVPRRAPRHDRDAGGPAELLAAKSALRDEVWTSLTAARAARFPGAADRIPNFTGAEAAAERLRSSREWRRARTIKSNPDSAQLPVRQRALEDGKTVYMAVPRLADADPFFLLDPDHLADTPHRAASIKGAARSARRVPVSELAPVDLVVTGCVAAGEDGARLGKGGGFADLEYAVAAGAGLIGPGTAVVTTVHELQLRPAGVIPVTDHDMLLDLVITPERIIDCREEDAAPPGSAGPGMTHPGSIGPGSTGPGSTGPGSTEPGSTEPGRARPGRARSRPAPGIRWEELTEEKIAAIPLLAELRSGGPGRR